MSIRSLIVVAVLGYVASAASTAEAILIDFESFADGENLHNLNLGGVTLSSADGIVEVFDDRFTVGSRSGTKAILNDFNSPTNPLVGVFDTPVTSVRLWAGDDHPDADDTWELRAYDAATGGTLLGTVTESGAPWNGDPYRELTLSFPNIRRFEASSTTSVGYDDLSFTPVPEPQTMAIGGVAMLLATGIPRRRRPLDR